MNIRFDTVAGIYSAAKPFLEARKKLTLVSVIIASFNNSRLLVDAVDSALASKGVQLEVIVVDDGSTDDTADVVKQYGDGVRYIRQQNGGVGAARNRGHLEARGNFIAWLDSDDVAEPDRFRLQVDVLARHPDVGVICTDFSAFDDRGIFSASYAGQYYSVIARKGLRELFPKTEIVSLERLGVKAAVAFHSGRIYPEVAYTNFIHPPTVMMRRSVWSDAGPLDSQYSPATEWEFFARAARLVQFGYLELPLLRYRRSRGQMTDEANVGRNIPREMKAFEAILTADPTLRADSARVRHLYRHWNLALAAAAGVEDRARALRYLMRSTRYGLDPAAFGITASRLFAPAALMPTLGRLRRKIRALRAVWRRN